MSTSRHTELHAHIYQKHFSVSNKYIVFSSFGYSSKRITLPKPKRLKLSISKAYNHLSTILPCCLSLYIWLKVKQGALYLGQSMRTIQTAHTKCIESFSPICQALAQTDTEHSFQEDFQEDRKSYTRITNSVNYLNMWINRDLITLFSDRFDAVQSLLATSQSTCLEFLTL